MKLPYNPSDKNSVVEYAKKQTIEEIVISKFKPYYGKTEEEIVKSLKIEIN